MSTIFSRQNIKFQALSLEERQEYNLEAIKEISASVHDRLLNYKPATSLRFDDDGNPDMFLEDVPFFNNRYGEIYKKRRTVYSRMQLSDLTGEVVDEEAGKFVDALYETVGRNNMRFGDMPDDAHGYFYLSFGVAFGAHLYDDIKKYSPGHLILVEPNFDLLFHSLSTLDWREIVNLMDENDGEIHFILDGDEEVIASNLILKVDKHNIFEMDGLLIHHHYDSPILSAVSTSFKNRYMTLVQGLGFFFDETIMLSNAHRNLSGGKARLYKRKSQDNLNVPVFVIGSGPSLDKDLPHIRKWQDKAIIIACGSAILPLLSNGIKPDFQIELENIAIERMMVGVAEKYDLSDICLVAAATVQPSITRYFKDIIHYHREALSPFSLMLTNSDRALSNPGPTVVNAGLSFAQESGFRKFFLFGADMGKRNPDGLHHSKDTYHYTPNANHYSPNSNIPIDEFGLEVKANFGGISHTSDGLFHTKTVIDHAMRSFNRGRTYYNCSDGAAFTYALPYMAQRLELPDLPVGKEIIVSRLRDAHPVFTVNDFKKQWDDDLLVKSVNHYVDEITQLFCTESFSLSNNQDVTELMTKYIKPSQSLADWMPPQIHIGTAIIFRGTIMMALIGLRYVMHRLDEKDASKLEKYAKELFLDMMEDMREKYHERIGYLMKRTESGEDTNFLGEEFI